MPRAKLTQTERLLRWSRAGRVLDQGEWFAAGADGGPPVTALRSRVADLERRGYRFRHVLRRGRLAQYWLVAEPSDAQPQDVDEAALEDASVGALDDQLPLLSTDPARVGHYDCWDG
jgi:hypothetical protein